ncbi:MAG: DUF3040 domain-containing protein [Microthrixaceae bacterium]
MPLSEHEQRILSEIEQGLRNSDPRFANHVDRSFTVGRNRSIRFLVAAVVAGFVLTMVLLDRFGAVPAFLVGFSLTLLAALALEFHLGEALRSLLERYAAGVDDDEPDGLDDE